MKTEAAISLGIEIAKVVGAAVLGGIAGYQATGTLQGAIVAAGTAVGGLFAPPPRKLTKKQQAAQDAQMKVK